MAILANYFRRLAFIKVIYFKFVMQDGNFTYASKLFHYINIYIAAHTHHEINFKHVPLNDWKIQFLKWASRFI